MSETKNPPPKEEVETKKEKNQTVLLDEEPEAKPAIPSQLALLPLRDSVVFPLLIAPLSVGRANSINLLNDKTGAGERIIGVVSQKDPQIDEPTFDDIYHVGCAVIIRTLINSDEAIRLIVQGIARFRIVEQVQTTPYLVANIEVIDEPVIDDKDREEVEALRRSVNALFEQAVRLSPMLPDELRSLTQAVNDPLATADLVAAHTPLSVADKQSVLESPEAIDRLKVLLDLLGREVRVMELTTKVQSEVSQELSRSQRDYYLREQIKAIQRELGEGDDPEEDLEDLRVAIEAANLPEVAQKQVDREFKRLGRINPSSPEYTVVRTYIETMAALPWNTSTEDNFDLDNAKATLDEDHAGLEKVKNRIIEFLAVRKMKGDQPSRQPILCFVGPPGVGKTSLGRSIARALDRKFCRLSLGGVRDEAEIRGHRRTYIGSMPGQIIQNIRRAESNNPVFILDEIDKLGQDFRGDPASALLEVLDPEQNDSFRDHYVDAPFSLARVFFITTANRLDTIPHALRDRMEIIELGGYTEEEKVEIATKHLLPKQLDEHGLSPKKVAADEEALRFLIRHYTREAGVRNLERELAGVLRKAAMKFAAGRKAKLRLSKRFVQESLGAPRYVAEEITERELKPGVAVGMSYSTVGGNVLFIESSLSTGSQKLVVTGKLGEVMKESAQIALTYIRSEAKRLGIDPEKFQKTDVHIHAPAGAIPKEGPSAGVTMVTSLASAFTGRRVKSRLAMTGEVTLTGQVLPVGGIKEKLLAAYRAGVQEIILPQHNKKDFMEDIPEDIRNELTVHYVKDARQVLKLALAEPASDTSNKQK